MTLRKLKQDWDVLGDVDPFWAILTNPEHKGGKWDIHKFFLTGERKIERVMESAVRLGYPSEREVALDFGCGVGRLTRALAKYFQQCYGVDISESMIAKAKELNRSIPSCKFIVNTEEHLRMFSDSYFDMIYTYYVLQHIPNKTIIELYISEFVRTLKQNGLLVFQLTSCVPLKNRLQPRRRLYALLTALGFDEKFLYQRLGLVPIAVNFIPEKEVIAFLNAIGAKVLEVQADSKAGSSNPSRTYYVTKQ